MVKKSLLVSVASVGKISAGGRVCQRVYVPIGGTCIPMGPDGHQSLLESKLGELKFFVPRNVVTNV